MYVHVAFQTLLLVVKKKMAKVQEDGAVKEIHRTNKRQEAKPLYHCEKRSMLHGILKKIYICHKYGKRGIEQKGAIVRKRSML